MIHVRGETTRANPRWQPIFAHVRDYWQMIIDWRLGALVGLCVALLLLFAQFPFVYRFNVGQERGPNSDQPFLDDFNPPEGVTSDSPESWRWTKGTSAMQVPGVGARDVVLGLRIISHKGQHDPQAPPTLLNLQIGDGVAVPIALRRERAFYQIYVPRHAVSAGVLRVQFATEPWKQDGDRRELGVAIGKQITISGTRDAGFVLPDTLLLVGWPLGLGLLWLALRVCGFSARAAFALLMPLAIIVPALLLIEAPRLGFGALWAVQAGASALVFAAVCAWYVPPLLAHFGALPKPRILRWLLLLVVLSFVLKAVARLYPDSMPGDINLHNNRFQLTNMGTIFIAAQHRGLPFPFPTGLYLLLAPLTLTGIGTQFWFPFTAGLFEATTVVMLYLLLQRVTSQPRLGLLAATLYALTAAGFMTTWFSFQTQIGAQWFFILLMLVLVLRWPRYNDWWTWSLIVVLLLQVYLGHIGLFINTTLLGALVAAALWWRVRGQGSGAKKPKSQGDKGTRTHLFTASTPTQNSDLRPQNFLAARSLFTAGLAAALFVAVFYYSAFTGLIVSQLGGATTEGLNGATGRQPVPRLVSLQVLWNGGLITHFGFFPVLLGGAGALLLARRYGRTVLPALVLATFAVSASQAVLPFITLSSITTRWLVFSAWAIAIAGALAFDALWRRGRGAQLVVIAMLSYVAWVTLSVWINAIAYRLPPIEPF